MHHLRPIEAAILFLWAFFLTGPLTDSLVDSFTDSLSNSSCLAGSHTREFSHLVENGGYIVTSGNRNLVQQSADSSFVPASTIKIATALLALDSLGPDFHFRTEFYLRRDQVIVIKGYGDPFLVSEMLPPIAKGLKDRGISSIGGLVLDQTYFAATPLADGSGNSTNPYDAPNTPLAVNFNALPILKHDTSRIESGEPQTPLLPIMLEIGNQLTPGRHRVNVDGFPLQSGTPNADRYAAELFISLFRATGIDTAGDFTRGTVQESDRLLYTHYSDKSLRDLIHDSLKYSSNFMANQLFLASGAQKLGPPADWQKSARAMADFLQECCSIDPSGMTLVEGSGLSRRNSATPGAMLQLLRSFTPHAALLSEENGVLLKSGSLQDVHNYVGYFTTPAGFDPFVIFLNQARNTRLEVLQLLQQIHQDSQSIRTGAPSP